MTKPRFRLIAHKFVPMAEGTSPVDLARTKFGRGFSFEAGGNFLRQPEHCLSRWSRRADYFNLNPNLPRPPACACHFKERK